MKSRTTVKKTSKPKVSKIMDKTITISISTSVINKIRAFQKRNKCKSFSSAVRDLIFSSKLWDK